MVKGSLAIGCAMYALASSGPLIGPSFLLLPRFGPGYRVRGDVRPRNPGQPAESAKTMMHGQLTITTPTYCTKRRASSQ